MQIMTGTIIKNGKIYLNPKLIGPKNATPSTTKHCKNQMRFFDVL